MFPLVLQNAEAKSKSSASLGLLNPRLQLRSPPVCSTHCKKRKLHLPLLFCSTGEINGWVKGTSVSIKQDYRHAGARKSIFQHSSESITHSSPHSQHSNAFNT